MEDRFDPSEDRDNTTQDTGTYASADGGSGDDDLMGAIGIDLESGIDEPDPGMLEASDLAIDSTEYADGESELDEFANLDPYSIGANVAGMVRQLVSQKLDRIITVAVEQAVVKELKRIQGKKD